MLALNSQESACFCPPQSAVTTVTCPPHLPSPLLVESGLIVNHTLISLTGGAIVYVQSTMAKVTGGMWNTVPKYGT